MMRLSTMWKVDGTIDADGSSPVAERILERWTYDRGSVRFFRSSANFMYAFQTKGKHHFLRFADNSERRRETIAAEVELLRWLATAGIDIALPVESRLGNLMETVDTDWGEFHAVVFPALVGEQLEIGDLDESGFRRWGAALGGLHVAMDAYPGTGVSARPTWRDHLAFIRQYLPHGSSALGDELAELTSSLAHLTINRDTYGPIHFDFELDNLVWREDSVGIIDFDDCSHLWYTADIAFALGDLFEENVDLGDNRFRAFVGGYSERRDVDPNLKSHVPMFLRFGGLLRYARIVRAVDLPIRTEDPDWLVALSRKLHDRMAVYRASVESRWA